MFTAIAGALLLVTSGGAAVIALAAAALGFHKTSNAFVVAAIMLFGSGVLLILI